MIKIKRICFFPLFLLSFVTPAFAHQSSNNFEISVAGGANWMQANNSSYVISPYETDRLVVNHIANNAVWKAGVGYHFFAEKLKQQTFLDDLLLELNYYHSSATMRGNVWQYQLPQFNNYSFAAPITSNRLMLDVKPNLFTCYHFSPYAIFGAGITWNKMSYTEAATGIDVDPASSAALKNQTTTHAAYDLGAGVRFDLNSHFGVFAEYLYTNLGHASPSSTPKNTVMMVSSPKFSVRSQAVLFGVSCNF